MFRVFLCDEMKAVALVDHSKKSREALGLFRFGNQKSGPMVPIAGLAAANAEGGTSHVNPQCVVCHRKLDPAMALNSGGDDTEVEFVYDDFSGKEHRLKVRGLKDLANRLMSEPQYARCQVQKMWNWYIGQDYPLASKLREELAAQFTSTSGDFRSLISTLVARSEFYDPAGIRAPPTLTQMKPQFNRCNSCHESEGTIPSFTNLPIGGRHHHVAMLTKIMKVVDIPGNGKRPTMPPRSATWSLTESDRKLLVRWIYAGARDENGRPTLNDQERAELMALVPSDFEWAPPAQPQPSFRDNWTRYLENFDVLKVLGQKMRRSVDCGYTLLDNLSAYGFLDTNTGYPGSDYPPRDYLLSLGTCVSRSLRESAGGYAPQFKAMAREMGLDPNRLPEMNASTKWAALAPPQKERIVDEILRAYIGPGVLPAQDHLALRTLVVQTLAQKPKLNLVQALVQAVYLVALDHKFLTL
ncbi:MAG: DUF1800 family protein [Bdellovibrionales bacterium]